MITTRKRSVCSRRHLLTVLTLLFIVTIYLLLSVQLFIKVSDIPSTREKIKISINFHDHDKTSKLDEDERSKGNPTRLDTPSITQTKQQRINNLQLSSHVSSTLLKYTGVNKEKIFVEWRKVKITACNGDLELFSGQFVSFRDVLFRKYLVSSVTDGGEALSSVMQQREDDEYYKINSGFFSLVCLNFPLRYSFPSHKGHVNKWLSKILPVIQQDASLMSSYVKDFTIIIKRYEYVNLYHTMTDFYGAFLMMKFFKKSPQQTNILFFDTHPKGALDPVWNILFGSTKRVSGLENITQFKQAVWSIPGYDTPMYSYNRLPNIPLIEDFHNFFLDQHGIKKKPEIDCKHLNLLAIWRRDYVAHPRNPSGRIERKIWNEEELLAEANKTGLFSSIIGIQLDKLSMKRQLTLISNADILVGMHGAGLTHTLFLPSYGGLIELLPLYFSALGHFEGLARWRNLHYIRWKNDNIANEMSERRTRVPQLVFRKLLLDMKEMLCGGQKK